MKKIIVLTLIILIGAGACGAGYVYYDHMVKLVEHDKIYDGITIHDIAVGGLTKSEAIQKLNQYITSDHEKKKLILFHGEENWVLNYLDWGFKADLEAMVDKAFSFGRSGNLFERYKMVTGLEDQTVKYDISYTYNEKKIDKILTYIEGKYNCEPVEATIKRVNGQFVVTEDVVGKTLDVKASRQRIKDKLDQREEGRVELVVMEKIPDLRKEFLDNIQDTIGAFHTEFSNSNYNRNKNLEVACVKMNNRLMMPGEVFSLMQSIGPVDTANGYKAAPIILNGKLIPGVGGGICQVATTVYNAVLNAELEIVQRQNHSMPVAYVPLGHDAAVSGSTLDFKFTNNMEFPIFLQAYALNNKLYVNIYGKETRPANRKIKYYPVVLSKIQPPPTQVKYDPKLPSGKEVFELTPKAGYKVKLMKETAVDGKVMETVVANQSYYRPRAGIKKVGSKKVSDADEKGTTLPAVEPSEFQSLEGEQNTNDQENSQEEENNQNQGQEENNQEENQENNQEGGEENQEDHQEVENVMTPQANTGENTEESTDENREDTTGDTP